MCLQNGLMRCADPGGRCYRLPMAKAAHARDVKRFTDIPNIGPAMSRDFALLGVKQPDLASRDAFELYRQLCERTGTRQDPCVLDTFLAAVDFMRGGGPLPWWHFTDERKKRWPDLSWP